MTRKKITWKSIIFILSCYKTNYPLQEKQVLKRGSFQRLCLSDISNSSSFQAIDDLSVSLLGSKLHIFSLEELKEATHNFSWSNLLGEGGFGSVHKGFVDDKLRPGLKAQSVAVKRLDLDGLQGHREWLVSSLNKPTSIYPFLYYSPINIKFTLLIFLTNTTLVNKIIQKELMEYECLHKCCLLTRKISTSLGRDYLSWTVEAFTSCKVNWVLL